MKARKLHIHSRHRDHPGVIASLADFDWRGGESLSLEALFADPTISLYCLDHSVEQAIFTKLPDGIDLSQAPFMYQKQFDSAEHLIALPYLDFIGFADSIELPEESALFLHNIGRCGSTALCRFLNEAPGVVALSEPDALTGILTAQFSRSMGNDLIRASMVWLFRPAVMGGESHYVVKLRNQATAIMKAYVDSMPQAKHIFLYRNVLEWLASFHRLRVNRGDKPARYSRQQIIEQQVAYFHCPPADIEPYAPPEITSYLSLEGRALGWFFMLGRYLDLHDNQWPIRAMRYEDLQADRDGFLNRVFAIMGLPSALSEGLSRAFDQDAQAGTIFARDGNRGNTIDLPASMQATVGQLLAYQPVLNRAEFILPGTI